MTKRIALVVSHPIQHFCPQYVSFASNKEITFRVFFASALGYKSYFDPNFKSEVSWGNLNLNLFEHEFLNGEAVIPVDRNLDAPSLDARLKIYSPDVVIVYGYFQRVERRAHRWAVKRNVPVAYISDSELRHKRNWIKEMVKYLWIYHYFSKISHFLSVGNANESFYNYYGVGMGRVIRMHFPIDIVQYEAAYASRELLRKAVRERYQIDDDRVVISVVGKLTPWKNQDQIIKALQQLEKQGVYLTLFIIGSGDMLEAWRLEASSLNFSTVHFTGFVGIDELPGYYASTDVYVHPASLEPHSIAISEAIYMGCPIITSDRSGSYGPTDDVQESQNGYVLEFGNTDQLAQCIKGLAGDPALRKRMADYSHRIAVEFQRRAHYGALMELIEKQSS